MSGTIPPMDSGVETLLRLFFPQFFDPESPSYVDPILLNGLAFVAMESRPWCLPPGEQDLAQAFFTAYLVGVRQETSTGKTMNVTAGPITMEKEGDIQVQYATSPSGSTSMSKRPASDPWDAWNRLWMRCAKGVILTRFGDPCQYQSSPLLTKTLALKSLNLISNTLPTEV